MVTPGGDDDHAWVVRFTEALGKVRETRLVSLDLSDEELAQAVRGSPTPSPEMMRVHAERSRRAGARRRARAEDSLPHRVSCWCLQIYTNDSLPLDRVDAVLTDVLLHMVVDHAHLLDGYVWDPGSLEDALEREIGVLSAAERIFVPTNWAADWIAEHMPAGLAAKTRVVGWGPGAVFPEAKPPLSAVAPTLLFIGNDADRKGLRTTVEAFGHIRQFVPGSRLVVVGDVAPFPADGVHCVGKLDWRSTDDLVRLAEIYAMADLFVLPSRFEPVGCVFVEAMLAGLPIVALDTGAVPEVVGHDAGWLVPPDSPADLASALRIACEEPGERRARGEAGRQRACRLHRWERVATNIAEELDNAVPA